MADAPGEPGQPPRWLPSGKAGVGRALSPDSRVWFTLGDGILNEIAYPRIEQTAVRDFGLILTDGEALFAEERRDCVAVTRMAEAGIPAYDITTTHTGGRFTLEKRVIADPYRPALLQHVRLIDLGPADAPPLRVHALLAPHLVNVTGMGSAWVGDYKGVPMLFAEGQGTAVALAADCGWRARSAGFAGVSDGWQDLSRHRRMQWQYERAINGNVALTGELDWTRGGSGEEPAGFTVALGFGRIWTEAAMRARATLDQGFAAVSRDYVAGWRAFQADMRPLGVPGSVSEQQYRASLAAIRTHECPSVPGAMITSLGVPWAALQNDRYPAACHLVRARDMVAGAGALLAAGDRQPVLDALAYLRSVQEADGHWPQNFWLDGMPAWQGLQLDETAQPLLLADLALRHGLLDDRTIAGFWPMVRGAALFLAEHEPYEGQDRWGRSDGPAIHTIGVQLAALLAAAVWATRVGDAALSRFLFETADCVQETLSLTLDDMPRVEPDSDLVSLVRLGVVSPHDPRLLAALPAIDATLRVELPGGPGWCRRSHAGRPTRPVLAIERALLEVQSGRLDEARALLAAIEATAGEGLLLPERVDDESGRGGMVMPHLWTHAEHIKLLRSLDDGAVFDCPTQALARYPEGSRPDPRIVRWRPDRPTPQMRPGRRLRVELPGPAELHWSTDQWSSVHNSRTDFLVDGLSVAELPTDVLDVGGTLLFTWRELDAGAWHGVDYQIEIVA